LKWTEFHHSLELGAFSYHVSGYAFAARIGRYCSFGEEVQIGRQNHPMSWSSTSPAFYLRDPLFDVGQGFEGADAFHADCSIAEGPSTQVRATCIGNDVWIGHGSYIAAGISIGDGAVIAAKTVVVKDVPPFAVVAGNPGVIKKWRLEPDLISPMLRCAWWRFAPWQLKSLSPAEPARFIHNVMHLPEKEIFVPSVFVVGAKPV
jgi:acetyltransferase-like isoleucine patch superfamily enzyme